MILSETPKRMMNGTVMKSPSDTTIYAPALCKRKAPRANANGQQPIMPVGESEDDVTDKSMNAVMDKISNIVDAVRRGDRESLEGDQDHRDVNTQNKLNETMEREAAQKRTNQAEKYKALIAELPGENFLHNQVTGLTDDDFFHLTCHVEPNIIAKIEKGDFVELEKLLAKDKNRRSDENRLEWIQTEGNTYLAPVADRVNKISNFRKWEQAFRVYATIYCGAHPQRSKEIWQYVSVISTAASSFVWENVYEYDVTLRHLMAFNPSQSWAVTYNQMWNICMREPLPKTAF